MRPQITKGLGLFLRPNLTYQKRLTGEFPSINARRAKLAKNQTNQ
jgi:hypothetical protein